MAKRKKTWADIKATKPEAEWKRLNKVYGNRRDAKVALHKKAQELIERIYTSNFIYDEGLAKNLRNEIKKALRLPSGWTQEDYDMASKRLAEVARSYGAFANRRRQVNVDLLDAILVSFRLSSASDDEKLAVLLEAMLRIGNARETHDLKDCPQSMENFIYTLCRQDQGVYPEWFPKMYMESAINILNEADRKKLLNKLEKVVSKDTNMNFLQQILDNSAEEAENTKEITHEG